MTTCPYCAEKVPPAVVLCPSCGERLVAPPPAPPAPPAGPQIVGWLSAAFGVMGFLGPVMFVATRTLLPPMKGDPVQAAMAASDFYRAWTYFGQVLAVACSGVLLASGVGLIRWREWARRTAIAYAWFVIGLLPLSIGINVKFLTPAAGALPGPLPPELFLITTVCASLLALIFPVAILLVLRRPVVVATFAEREKLRAEGL